LTGTTPGNSTTPAVTVSGLTTGFGASIYSDSSCATSKGSGTVAAASTSIAINSSAIAASTTYYATQTDLAGNISACSTANFPYVYDTVVPTVTITSPAALTNVTNSNKTSFTVSGACSENGQTVFVAATSGATVNAIPTCSGSAWSASMDLSTLTDGSFSITADHIDAAGNNAVQASRSFFKDALNPVAVTAWSMSPASGSTSNNTTPTISGSGEGAATVQLFSDSGCATSIGSVTISGSGNSNPNAAAAFSKVTSALTNGSYTFYYIITDIAGNAASCATTGLTYILNTTPPAAPTSITLNTPASTPGTDSQPKFTVNSAALPASVATVYLYNNSSCTAGSSIGSTAGILNATSSVVQVSSALANATTSTNYYANFLDTAGNYSTCVGSAAYQYDSLAPVAVTSWSMSPSSGSTSNNTTPTISGSGEGAATVQLFSDSGCATSIGSVTIAGSGNSNPNTAAAFSKVTSTLTSGSYTFYYKITDIAGNVTSCATTGLTYNLDLTAPTVTIAKGSSQSDPTSALPVTFDVVFSEAIQASSFTASSISQSGSGTASGITWAVNDSGDHINFTVTATAVTSQGTLKPVIASGYLDVAGNSGSSATSSNTVTYNVPVPTISISGPTNFILAASTQSTVYTVTYTNVTAITLAASDVTVNAIGSVSGCTKSVSGTGLTTRTITVTNCAGTGGMGYLSIASSTASNSMYSVGALNSLSFISDTGINLWLSAEDLSAGAVSAWSDRSGASVMTVAQATSGNQPTSTSNIINGKPVVRFNGTSSFMSISGSPTIKAIFMVGKYNANQNGTNWFSGNNNDWKGASLSNTTAEMSWQNYSTSSIVAGNKFRDTNAHVFTFETDGFLKSTIDGEPDYRQTSTTYTPGGIDTIGKLSGSASGYLNGDIAEFIAITHSISTAERQAIEAYLANKYAIKIITPATVASSGYTVGNGFTHSLWLKADTGVTSSSNKVSTWADQSGSSKNAIQATGANQPTYVASAQNGLPAIRFDGSSSFLTFSGISPSSFTLFSTMKAASSAGKQTILGTNNTDIGIYLSNNVDACVYPGSGTVQTWSSVLPSANTSFTYATSVMEDSVSAAPVGSMTSYVNGVEYASKRLSSFSNWFDDSDTSYNFQMLGRSGSSTFLNGDISELLVYSSNLPTMDVLRNQYYLTYKYATAAPVPPAPFLVPGLAAWFRADNGVTKDSSNKISFWADQSAATRTKLASLSNTQGAGAYQATAAMQPLWVDNVLNGYPVIRFDRTANSGTGQLLYMNDLLGRLTNVTIFAVAKISSATSGGIMGGYYSGGNYQYALGLNYSGGNYTPQVGLGGGAGSGAATNQCVSSSTVSSGTTYLYSATYDGSNTTLYLNGSQKCQTAVSGAMAQMSNAAIGSEGYFAGSWNTNAQGSFTGDIAEILMFSTTLSNSDRQAVECYLSNKYYLGSSGCAH
jgi:hypothetical protein